MAARKSPNRLEVESLLEGGMTEEQIREQRPELKDALTRVLAARSGSGGPSEFKERRRVTF